VNLSTVSYAPLLQNLSGDYVNGNPA
jgi:hypothetical protein